MRGGDGTSTQPHSTASVQSRKAQTYVPVRDKVRSQPGREHHQAYRNSKGSVATESKEDRANATCVYRWMPQELAVLTTSQARDRVLEVRGGDVTSTQPHGTASVQSRKAQTYFPVRDKLRSQPERKDHQAYRNSKGS